MNAFSALGDPTRLTIVELLARHGQLPVSAIHQRFSMSAPAISQHLKVLREAKLVSVKVQGPQRLYAINPQAIAQIEGWAKTLCKVADTRFDALEEMLLEQIARNKKPAKKKRRPSA